MSFFDHFMEQYEEEEFKPIHESVYSVDGHSINEMAQFGKFGKYTVWVYAENKRPVSHFHFINKGSNKEGCIKLDEPEYFSHDGKMAILNSKEKKELIVYLNSEADGRGRMTKWEYLVNVWNSSNPRFKIPDEVEMPDYNEL